MNFFNIVTSEIRINIKYNGKMDLFLFVIGSSINQYRRSVEGAKIVVEMIILRIHD